MNVEIVVATHDHITPIAERVREADRQELFAIACLSAKDALERSWVMSDASWTGLIDGVPACMFGICAGSVLSRSARPWMIGTVDLDRHALAVLRRNKSAVDSWLTVHPRLENYVDVRNARAIRWLKWLGFQFGKPEPYGAFSLPFLKFWKERK